MSIENNSKIQLDKHLFNRKALAAIGAVLALSACSNMPAQTPEQKAVTRLSDDPRVFDGYVIIGKGAKILKQPVNIDNTDNTQDKVNDADVAFTVGSKQHRLVVMERPVVVAQANGGMALGCYYVGTKPGQRRGEAGSNNDYEWLDLSTYKYEDATKVPSIEAYYYTGSDKSDTQQNSADLTNHSGYMGDSILSKSLPLDLGSSNGPVISSIRNNNNYWPAICHDVASDKQGRVLVQNLQKDYIIPTEPLFDK